MTPIHGFTAEQFGAARQFVWAHGRLLERQTWRALCESAVAAPASAAPALDALRAYRNTDGGFGNGLEPDLLCPASSGIATETALWYLWLLGNPEPALAASIAAWAEATLDARGAIPHPPAGLTDYPHQPWWAGADDQRVLAVAGLLALLGVDAPTLTARAGALLDTLPAPDATAFYSYPALLFAHACGQYVDAARRASLLALLPGILDANRAHLPLLSRYWFWAWELVDADTRRQAAADVVAALQPDGGLADLYPQLPWWRPMFTLDALALLQRFGS